MKFLVTFGALAVLLVLAAVRGGGLSLLLLWPATSFLTVSAAYAGGGPQFFGKKPDGRMRLSALIVLLPYLIFTWTTWHLARLLSREPAYAEVVPGFFVGRRLLSKELPSQVATVLDLTAEFIEPQNVRRACRYISLPILDASVLPAHRVPQPLHELAKMSTSLYVHCAQGHGRTGMVAAALLFARGAAPDPRTALAMVQRVRPGVRLSAKQLKALDELACALKPQVQQLSAPTS